MSEIGYHSEVALQKKRVLYEPVVTTETLKEGYVVCYNNDRTTDLNGTSVSAGTTNPARFLQVEKPETDNLKFVAGIVCPSGEGAAYGDWVDIYLLNGADIPVWTDQNCVNGTTTLAVTDGSYIVTATGAANINLGIAKDTINRSGVGPPVEYGFCLMRSYFPAAPATTYVTISAALSVLSNAFSAFSVGEFDDVSDMASANSVLALANSAACSSLQSALSDLSSLTSVLSTQCASGDASLASALSDLSSLVVVISAQVSTTSNLAQSNALSITSLIAADTSGITSANTARSTLSDAVSGVTDSIASAIVTLSNAVSGTYDTLSAALSDETDRISSLITADASIATAIVTLSNAVSGTYDTLSAALSDETDRISSLITADASIATAIVTLSNAVSGLEDTLSAEVSVISVAVTALDNDATSSQASTKIVSTLSLLVGYKKVTLADGTAFSCVAYVTSAS